MQGFNMALGVGCNHCHIEMAGAPPNEKGVIPIDAAPDDKQTKKTARVMIGWSPRLTTLLATRLASRLPKLSECSALLVIAAPRFRKRSREFGGAAEFLLVQKFWSLSLYSPHYLPGLMEVQL